VINPDGSIRIPIDQPIDNKQLSELYKNNTAKWLKDSNNYSAARNIKPESCAEFRAARNYNLIKLNSIVNIIYLLIFRYDRGTFRILASRYCFPVSIYSILLFCSYYFE
jgi:hypothetical protein